MNTIHDTSQSEKKQAIKDALRALQDEDLQKTASDFFTKLGYTSERTLQLDGTPESFVKQFPALIQNTKTEQYFSESAESVYFIYQITDEEICTSQSINSLNVKNFDNGFTKSFSFVVVKLKPGIYARWKYAGMTREINKRFSMPTVVLFLNGVHATFAFVHRRENKKQQDRDVLEKVSLIRNVNCETPHRAHIDILAQLSLPDRMQWIQQNQKQDNFDGLLAAWLDSLGIEELNKRFYRELLGWYEWAVDRVKFPASSTAAPPSKINDHVIRFITRILFVWFIKEKSLVEKKLFVEAEIKPLLNKYDRDNDDYYRAILQNLFFATLNTEITRRSFSQVKNATHRNFNKYRYKDLLADHKELLRWMKQTPFINGGLFDCLDSEKATGSGGYRVDCFTDNKNHRKQLSVPNFLFFDEEKGLFSLLNKYQFTVEENTPIEQEVALDPELLGNVFENLLAVYNPQTREVARKQTGSYYTPKPIVEYMVTESLVTHLSTCISPEDGDVNNWQQRLRYLFDYEDAFADSEKLFTRQEIRKIVAEISELKVLDPAVGSGAFPMGILHKLTLALRRLDGDNKIWEGLQKIRAKERARSAFDTKDDEARETELIEINETFQNYRESDFGRKLYLIQNSIFGVDIQPIACQITKLRFFISLTIEQESNDDESNNFNIKPLPNLETRFIAADSLIGLQVGGKEILRNPEVEKLEKQLQENRERHFNANNRRKKLACASKDEKLRIKLAKVLSQSYQRDAAEWEAAKELIRRKIEKIQRELTKYRTKITATKQKTLLDDDATTLPILRFETNINQLKKQLSKSQEILKSILQQHASVKSLPLWEEAKQIAQQQYEQINENALKIAKWDPYDQNEKADWFNARWMYGVEDGFDVVIGNPPYIQLQKDGGRLGKLYKDCNFQTFAKSGDIYQLFYEKSHQQLKPTGYLCFITSNKWMRARYGKGLRNYFAKETQPLKLLDLGPDMFNATVDTNILLLGKTKSENQFQAATLTAYQNSASLPLTQIQLSSMKVPAIDDNWVILADEEHLLKQKIERTGTPLEKWDITINFGIKTGYDEAFVIDSAERDALVNETPKASKILKPLLRGRNIKRYHVEWTGLYLIAIHNGYGDAAPINVQSYPAVKRHLDKFFKQIEKRQDKGGTPYNLRSCNYHAEFEKEKIIYPNMTKYLPFTFDNQGFFANPKCYIITGNNLKYLLAVLNSTVSQYWIRHNCPKLGENGWELQKVFMVKLPIPRIPDADQAPFIRLVDAVLKAKAGDPKADTTAMETKINQLVYQLYDLTEDEVKIIESN